MKSILIGMTESDCHTVAIYLFELFLIEQGYDVVNLGACVSLERMYEMAEKLDVGAIVFGAQNGHAYDDLWNLEWFKKRSAVSCPVFLGGNITVGASKDCDVGAAFRSLGVDHVILSFEDFLALHPLSQSEFPTPA